MNSARNSAGFSLVELLVALSLMGLVIVGICTLTQGLLRISARVASKGELEEVRLLLRGRVSCNRTVTPRPAGCSARFPKDLIDLRDSQGNILIGTPFTKVGNTFLVRAHCHSKVGGKTQIIVEVGSTRPVSLAGFGTQGDPGWQDLFAGIPFGCVIP